MPVARDGDTISIVPTEKYGLSPDRATHLEDNLSSRKESLDEYVTGRIDNYAMYDTYKEQVQEEVVERSSENTHILLQFPTP